MKRYTGSSSVIITEEGASIRIDAIGVVNQDNLQQIKEIVAAGVGLYVIGVTDTPFQYDTGLGYDVGEYAGVLTVKGDK